MDSPDGPGRALGWSVPPSICAARSPQQLGSAGAAGRVLMCRDASPRCGGLEKAALIHHSCGLLPPAARLAAWLEAAVGAELFVAWFGV